jgi:hypothetical protein
MNRLKKAGFILFAVFCIAMFYGCTSQEGDASSMANVDGEAYPWELGTFEGLNARTEWRIIQDHYNVNIKPYEDYYKVNIIPYNKNVYFPGSVNDVRIISYYGTYNAGVVVTIDDGGRGVPAPGRLSSYPYPYEIDGIVFPWMESTYPYPKVWKNGQFDVIINFYMSGQLTRGDLQSIANYPQK